MRRPLLVCALLASTVSACTWVTMEPGAAEVRVARLGDDLSACSKRGEVAVSVQDKLGLYQRNELKVRDELETSARNEARSLSADTLQALNEPSAGEQRFAAYACGRGSPIARQPPASEAQPRQSDEAQTFPARED